MQYTQDHIEIARRAYEMGRIATVLLIYPTLPADAQEVLVQRNFASVALGHILQYRERVSPRVRARIGGSVDLRDDSELERYLRELFGEDLQPTYVLDGNVSIGASGIENTSKVGA